MRGKDNPVADTLSIADNVQLWIDYQDIAKAKQEDVKVQAYCQCNLEPTTRGHSFVELVMLKIRATFLLNMLGQLYMVVGDVVHGLSHTSVQTTRKIIAARNQNSI